MDKINTEAAIASVQAISKACVRFDMLMDDFALWELAHPNYGHQFVGEEPTPKMQRHLRHVNRAMRDARDYMATGVVDPLLLESMVRAAEVAMLALIAETQPGFKLH